MRPGDRFRPEDPALEQLDRLSDGWGCRLRADDPQHQLAVGIARDLRAAGFELHDCAAHAPTGGVCLTPSSSPPASYAGVIVTWTQHDVLAHAGDLFGVHSDVQEVMNYALADVLAILGWRVEQFGQASAHIVTGPRERTLDAEQEAER
jgi:hypothetical protein